MCTRHAITQVVHHLVWEVVRNGVHSSTHLGVHLGVGGSDHTQHLVPGEVVTPPCLYSCILPLMTSMTWTMGTIDLTRIRDG
jgi:hypothetical protein